MVLIIAANVPAAFDIPVNNNTCLIRTPGKNLLDLITQPKSTQKS